MRPIYTEHARRRMAKRGISEAEVESVLTHAYLTKYSRHSGNALYTGRVKGRRITVAIAPGSSPPRVVTVW